MASERYDWHPSDVFTVNFEQILQIVLVIHYWTKKTSTENTYNRETCKIKCIYSNIICLLAHRNKKSLKLLYLSINIQINFQYIFTFWQKQILPLLYTANNPQLCQQLFTCLKLTIETIATISCEIRSKLTIKAPKRRQWRRVFVVNFEHTSNFFLVFLLLTLNR